MLPRWGLAWREIQAWPRHGALCRKLENLSQQLLNLDSFFFFLPGKAISRVGEEAGDCHQVTTDVQIPRQELPQCELGGSRWVCLTPLNIQLVPLLLFSFHVYEQCLDYSGFPCQWPYGGILYGEYGHHVFPS